MKSTAILDLMVKDHIQLIKYLTDVEKNIENDSADLRNSFYCFHWNLEKHFFVEERAIFISYFPENTSKDHHYFSELMDQHQKILDKINAMRNNLEKMTLNELMDFKKILVKHKSFEEKNIYPIIDKEIDHAEKQYIIDRILEVRL